ncbi:chemotaxis protein CheA [Desulfovibrio oxamicus]|uniref:Chemotaxis protein CheA n=1 Tax=Nitratidesulfovibrio oxamicus TaxID=32016 RepID=A0ABS0J7A8_9BACT|nr:chemotaxis protein CheA [Nitratidesulfovibrio oxamicus]MBG3877831.1 chemotaxis protein CheA [Nitratidesulfovibrio oxamicus]
MQSQEDANRAAFIEEAHDLLAELETALLELEAQPDDRDLVARVFRAMHTIKGSGAMFGFDDIAHFTHDVETVFDRVRNGEVPVTRQLLDLTLASRDHIARLLHCAVSDEAPDLAHAAAITASLRALVPVAGTVADAPPHDADGGECPAEPEAPCPPCTRTWRVRFRPTPSIFFSGANPLSLLDELRELGGAQVFPHFSEVPGLDELQPELCHLWWDVLLSSESDEAALRDVFLFVEDDADIDIRLVDDARIVDDAAYKRLGEILIERGDVSADDLHRVLDEQRPLGRLLTDAGVVPPERVDAALAEQQAVRTIRQSRDKESTAREDSGASIRVAASKLDFLVDLVGELVIVQAQLSQAAHLRSDPGLLGLVEELERLSDELRDTTLGIRMLPIGTTFSKFRRLVRDLSAELGKDVELVTLGGETELDKTVIERLGDPLVHCLRNSLDHGVESPDVRAAAGKPRTGTVTLSAAHAGGEVLITIADDGAGIDPVRVLEIARTRGVIAPDVELPAREAIELIFAPGFSTAEKVTSVSGRGVGMDVVKRSIEALRGRIELDSTVGEGTSLTIRLPLTLAIIDGLQVLVGGESYVIPLNHVEECAEHATPSSADGRQRIINLRGEIVPYIRLRELFSSSGPAPTIEQVVVVDAQGSRFGLVVDCVVGEHQTVIKSLGRIYKDVPGISGATIKGDGSMALILDVPGLVQLAVDQPPRAQRVPAASHGGGA